MVNTSLRSGNQNRTLKFQEQLDQEHRELLAHLREVVSAQSTVELAPRLQQLYADLLQHFTHEQAPGGFYSTLEAFDAKYGPETKMLIDDHREILASLRRLIERTKSEGPDTRVALGSGVTALAKPIIRHERKEHRFARRLLAP